MLTNAFVGGELAVDAVNWVMEHLLGVSQPQTPVVPVSGDVLDACAGLYRTVVDDVELGRLGQALVAR